MAYKLAKKEYGALLTKVEGEGEDEVVTNAWAFNDHVGLAISAEGSSTGAALTIKAAWMEIVIPLAELTIEEEVPPVADPAAFMDAVGAVFVME